MTLTDWKQTSGKTWARIAAELSDCALARDPDRMNHIYQGRLWALLKGSRARLWEVRALEDYLGPEVSYN